jgi:hypothetical protein
MAIVHILGNVEDERCFSSLVFLKSKLRATLDPHLPLVVGMYNQKVFTLKVFRSLPHLMLGLEQLIVTILLGR